MSKDNEGFKELLGKMLGKSDTKAIQKDMQLATCEVRMTASLLLRLIDTAKCDCEDCVVALRIGRDFTSGEAFNKLTNESKKHFLMVLVRAERDVAFSAEMEKLEQQFAPKNDEPPTAYSAKPSNN